MLTVSPVESVIHSSYALPGMIEIRSFDVFRPSCPVALSMQTQTILSVAHKLWATVQSVQFAQGRYRFQAVVFVSTASQGAQVEY